MNRQQFRSADQGFTLPTAMGMGFVLMLLTASMLERAKSEQISATSRAKSELSMAVAEAGVTRFQAFLDRQRMLATRDLVNWQPDLTALESSFGHCVTKTEAQTYSQGDWLKLPTGKYRILSYSYLPQPPSRNPIGNTQIGMGKLLLEGQTNHQSQANSLLAVEMPISLTPTTLPALWATKLDLNRDQKITGNVRVRTCPDSSGRVLGITNENIVVGADHKPSGAITASISPWPQARPIPDRNIELPMISADVSLPRPGDWPNDQGVYNYVIQSDIKNQSIDLPAGKKLTVKLKDKESVNLYIKGNISIGGQVLAIDETTNTPQPHKLRIYGGTDTKELLIFDSATITALIHAPVAEGVGYASTEMGQGITGILWLKSWNSSNYNSRLRITQAGSWDDLEIPAVDRLGVRIHPLSSWQRQAMSLSSSSRSSSD
jgi:hypothetical protein